MLRTLEWHGSTIACHPDFPDISIYDFVKQPPLLRTVSTERIAKASCAVLLIRFRNTDIFILHHFETGTAERSLLLCAVANG